MLASILRVAFDFAARRMTKKRVPPNVRPRTREQNASRTDSAGENPKVHSLFRFLPTLLAIQIRTQIFHSGIRNRSTTLQMLQMFRAVYISYSSPLHFLA